MSLTHRISDWLFNQADQNLKDSIAWAYTARTTVVTPWSDLCLLFSKYHLAVARVYMKLGTWVLT